MGKLKFNQKYFKTEICGQEIEFRKWNAGDEKAFLKVLNSKKENINDLDIYETLIKPILKKPVELTSNEQKYLLTEVRKVSYGDKVIQKIECPKCGNIDEVEINLNEAIKFKCSNFKTIEIIIDEDKEEIVNSIEDVKNPSILKIQFGRKNITKFKNLIFVNHDPIDYIFTSFITFIEKIEYNGETLEINSKKDFKEAQAFFDTLPNNIFEEIIKQFSDMIDDFKIKYNYKCSKCGYKEPLEFDNIFDFIWK